MFKPLSVLTFALSVLALAVAPLARATMEDDVRALQRQWEEVKYQKPKAQQEAAFEALAKSAGTVRDKYPDRVEPEIWYGIIVAEANRPARYLVVERAEAGVRRAIKRFRIDLKRVLERLLRFLRK